MALSTYRRSYIIRTFPLLRIGHNIVTVLSQNCKYCHNSMALLSQRIIHQRSLPDSALSRYCRSDVTRVSRHRHGSIAGIAARLSWHWKAISAVLMQYCRSIGAVFVTVWSLFAYYRPECLEWLMIWEGLGYNREDMAYILIVESVLVILMWLVNMIHVTNIARSDVCRAPARTQTHTHIRMYTRAHIHTHTERERERERLHVKTINCIFISD